MKEMNAVNIELKIENYLFLFWFFFKTSQIEFIQISD